MNAARILVWGTSCLTALMLMGCTANAPYRTSFASSSLFNDSAAVIESTPDYKLGFVEFDDQGWLWDKHQPEVVEQMIRAEAGMDPLDPDASPKGILLVTFVHGWKDNAAYDNDGVVAFRSILKQLNLGEQKQDANHPPRKVVGVYVGWRGLSATWEPFKELSFWERKEVAHKVGGYGALTQLLVDLENIQKDNLKQLPPNAPRTDLVIIGHSMGAGAVYSALAQIITERTVKIASQSDGSTHKTKLLKLPGDQVIFLNPAFEAVRHFNLNELAVTLSDYADRQRPVFSIFTSKGDWATHYMFPLGRFFSTLFDNNRDCDQASANLDAVGWYKPFGTHELLYNPKVSFSTTQPGTFNSNTGQHVLPDAHQVANSVRNVKMQRDRWDSSSNLPQAFTFDDSVLKPIPGGFHPGDPFLVVSVDRQIMSGHTDITNPVLINFMREYIQFCQADVNDHLK